MAYICYYPYAPYDGCNMFSHHEQWSENANPLKKFPAACPIAIPRTLNERASILKLAPA